jgi:hypothetical protein
LIVLVWNSNVVEKRGCVVVILGEGRRLERRGERGREREGERERERERCV